MGGSSGISPRLITVIALFLAGGTAAVLLLTRSGREDGSREGSTGNSGQAFVNAAPRLGIDRILAAGSPPKFYILENVGSGAGILDFDGDGRLDIFLANAGWIREKKLYPGPGIALYRQLPGFRFEEVSDRSGLQYTGWGTGVAVGDIENDGDPDIFLGTLELPLLFRNEGGRFVECAGSSGLIVSGYASSAAFLDYDRDGDLDLYVARYVEFDFNDLPNRGNPCIKNGVLISCGPTLHTPVSHLLYRNKGNGTFEEVSRESGMSDQPGSYGLGVVVGDVDNDGWPDIYASNDTTANFLWHNLGDGTFEEIGIESGCALGENAQGQSGMGVDMADVNGDGRLEIFVANYSEEYNAYYSNLGGLSFEDRTYASGLNRGCFLTMGWGSKFIDYDQDGALDLFVVNGHVMPQAHQFNPVLHYEQPILFYQGDGAGRFRRMDLEMGPEITSPRAHRSTPVGDIDGDGDLDIVCTVLDDAPLLLLNQVGQRRRAIILRLQGTRSNREGIGARIELQAGGSTQVREVTRSGAYLSASDAAAHFGMAELSRADSIRISWPSGSRDILGPLETGATYLIQEGGIILSRTKHGNR